MVLHLGIFTSILGMFTANLIMYYILLYHSAEYNNKIGFKRFINIINVIIIAISLMLLTLLIFQFIKN